MTPQEREWMQLALDLAASARGQTSPNPMVGAVIVNGGAIVGRGSHRWTEKKHAEVLALEEAGEKARGAVLYVTLEPCSHTGRTGPCADAVIGAGIQRVVIAMADPNPLVNGSGLQRLREAGVEVEMAEDFCAPAQALNEAFVHFQRFGRPLVTLKAAVTLDGKIAAPEDNRGWITSVRARQHVQTLRYATDAIATGIGTLLSDDCLLSDRTGQPRSRHLLRIVLDSQLRAPPDSRMVASCQGDVLIASTSAANPERRKMLESRGVEVVECDGPDGRVSLRLLVEELARRKILSLMVEGGSKVNWAFLESGIADKIFFYYAPKILGGVGSLPVAGGVGRQSRSDAIRLRDLKLHQITEDEFAVEAWLRKEEW
jgi:diaminohydroxyphosphoribosylaminopyrimidine deaminase/5-amino-6-(5-phosphoribosylamino)uracil reductase